MSTLIPVTSNEALSPTVLKHTTEATELEPASAPKASSFTSFRVSQDFFTGESAFTSQIGKFSNASDASPAYP